jgi:DNA primase catalytic subunit
MPHVPAHVYATILRFLNASRLTNRVKPAYCLSGPLVLDFDQTTHPLYSDEALTQLKTQIIDTMDFLTDWYNLTDYQITFSGYKGFHLYVHDFPEKCLKKNRNSKKWGTQRESYERQQRYRIAWQLRQAGITCDFPVSTDT